MTRPVESIVIVGGGTAGWLTAAYLAARRSDMSPRPLTITLVESPNIPTIGVGEGTWPTLRATLAAIGIGEAEFLTKCDASFKQGSRFDGWVTGEPGDSYLHPFTPPPDANPRDLIAAWTREAADLPFSSAMTAQAAVCARDLAPRQRSMPDYAGALNYAYHLDAAKLAALLEHHAVNRLGVIHIVDEVTGIERDADGYIAALRARDHPRLEGDLFIDCSGLAAVLIGGHCGAKWVDRSDILFNDRALALQVPVSPQSAIASQTIGTAHQAGWIWDIGLPTRRGVGCVYSSRFMSDDDAETTLRDYLARTAPDVALDGLIPRKLTFPTGHQDESWKANCLAIGLAAGFVEPLEASAIVLIELSLRALADNFPVSREVMPIHARRFNELFRERWERIVEFLKLHYLLSRRSEPYWQAHRDPATIPARLADLVRLWSDQPPSTYDFPLAEELFPAASYQYVYYGMGGPVPPILRDQAPRLTGAVRQRERGLLAALPSNRAYLQSLSKDRPASRSVLKVEA
jgi:tryptophan 7-halogenase